MINPEWSESWPAPAKLNLLLRVRDRRADGYHNLQTVFQFIKLSDELDFRVSNNKDITLSGSSGNIPTEQNLIYRAARLLQTETGTSLGAEIRIQKQLPMGGGLGGGSSDAATTLCALNQLWQCQLSKAALAKLGLRLGADVPIFIHGKAAWAEGIGEQLTDIHPPETHYLVIIPPCHVSTAKIFQDPELTRGSPATTIRAFAAGDTPNDCLPLVRKRYPEVAKALEWLDQHTKARLTGTGACIFGTFTTAEAARKLLDKVPDGLKAFVTTGMNTSPLLERLAQESSG